MRTFLKAIVRRADQVESTAIGDFSIVQVGRTSDLEVLQSTLHGLVNGIIKLRVDGVGMPPAARVKVRMVGDMRLPEWKEGQDHPFYEGALCWPEFLDELKKQEKLMQQSISGLLIESRLSGTIFCQFVDEIHQG